MAILLDLLQELPRELPSSLQWLGIGKAFCLPNQVEATLAEAQSHIIGL